MRQVFKSSRDTNPYIPPLSNAAAPFDAGSHAQSADDDEFPPVFHDSGQRPGEDMDAFFLRRERIRNEKILHETPSERQRREQREANAAKGNGPGRHGARVYVWEKVRGHYMRELVGRDRWEDFGPEQRRYNSVNNEWDLCFDFGADAEPEEDEDDSYDDNYMLPLNCLPPQDDDGLIEMLPETEEEPNLEDGEDGEVYTSEAELKRLKRIREETEADTISVPLIDPAHMNIFLQFLKYCKQSSSLSDIPPTLLDFHQNNSELKTSDWTVRVRRAVLNDHMHYLISEKTREQWRGLCIVVRSATTALEIVRQGWGPDLRDVMTQMLSRGMPFFTCCRFEKLLHAPAPAPCRFRYSGLGLRPVKYKFNLLDYNAYISNRRKFLLGPRGRAALLYGGVVGRIARSEGVSEEDVFRGPTDDAFTDGISLWDGHSTSAYWDDCLTEQEIDMICGVYHVATGTFSFFFPTGHELTSYLGFGNQTTTVSWWPRPAAIAASGINVGWWTPMWEVWYQKRLEQVKNGDAALATHDKWKRNLRIERGATAYSEGVEKCAAQILEVLRP
ncbi:hypothetical protein DFH09DRAFT_916927 [Mycena vulgaris]|nr:hypothetical protein DFH09DRAFT_916927 [Mycena vulgaris]